MRRSGDERLVRSAARGIAAQAALGIALAMLLMIALATGIVVHEQRASSDDLLRSTVTTADDVNDPPSGVWLVITDPGEAPEATPGLPTALAPTLQRLRTGTSGFAAASLPGRAFRVLTQERSGTEVQAVLDLRPEHLERNHLFEAMGAAAALSLVAAAGLGALLARRAVRPLADALGLQRAFVADASHELRAPLTLLSTRVQLLDRELAATTSDAQLVADSRGVVADVRRLGEIVEDLLVAADPRGDDDHVESDLHELAAEVCRSAQAHATEAGLRLVTPGPRLADAHVTGAPAALRRAILALVDNAIDHTPAGGSVTVQVRRDSQHVVVQVADTGPGLTPEQAKASVARFRSGGQRSGRAHYGLGLALTHDVANRHGGHLRLLPSEEGAVFELSIPARG